MGAYRDYMREDYPRERTSVIVWLICALVAAFILQNVFWRWFNAEDLITQYVALSAGSISHFRLWTLVSYAFLHDPNNLLHIIFVIVGLYFIGREVLAALGTKSFLALYFASAVFGGIVWQAIHWGSAASLQGASAAISGLFYLFVCLNPNRPITFLLLFIPITLPKTKYLAYAAALVDLFGFAFYELSGGGSAVAHSAHLGGMLLGLGYYRFVYRKPALSWPFSWPRSREEAEVIPPRWASKAGQESEASYRINFSERDRIKAEVDRILDKINSKGFGSLTTEEKRTLDEAKDLLNKH